VRFILDVNVLVALLFPAHPQNRLVQGWFHKVRRRQWATCPITQAGFVRVACLYLGEPRRAVQLAWDALEEECKSPDHEFWPVSANLCAVDLPMRGRVLGPKQMTDLVLVLTAAANQASLATLDSGIRELVLGTEYESSVLLLR
jgi:uncharacterized protein